MPPEAAIIGVVTGATSAGVVFAGFWFTLGGRLRSAEKDGQSALQITAETGEAIKTLAERLTAIERDLRQGLAGIDKEVIEAADRVRREFGGTIEAMRTKIHDIETWARDEFVRKESFGAVIARYERAQETRDSRLEARLDRIEKKIDAGGAGS